MRRIPMNTNRPSDHIEQNFRFLFPTEFLELNIQRSYKSTQHEREKNVAKERGKKRKKWNILKWVISTYLKHIAVSRLQTPNNVYTYSNCIKESRISVVRVRMEQCQIRNNNTKEKQISN